MHFAPALLGRRRYNTPTISVGAGNMKCPFCGNADTQVVDSRVSEEGDTIRRRRRCLSCDKRFTTYERIELAMPSVVKRNGSRSDYDTAKLRASLAQALRKRPASRHEIESTLSRIDVT